MSDAYKIASKWRDGLLAERRPENAAFRLDWVEYEKLKNATAELLAMLKQADTGVANVRR